LVDTYKLYEDGKELKEQIKTFKTINFGKKEPDKFELIADRETKKKYIKQTYYIPCGPHCSDPTSCGEHTVLWEIKEAGLWQEN